MVKLHNEQLIKVSSWPTDLLFNRQKTVVGFVMPKITGYKEIHKLYGPKTRLNAFPLADWAFIIHAAANLAKAAFGIHQNGQVIGDINHNNIVVADNGIVQFIDCDSFQVESSGKTFACDVGVLTHQPPEFQSKTSFRGLVRNQNHDNFGLAVLIFQLLFMGRHPFSGQYIGSGEMSLEKAIKEYRFAYGKNANQQLMKQPPGSLSLNSIPEKLAMLFERAFSSNGSNGVRPRPQEWIEALEFLSKRLKKCSFNRAHTYYIDLKTCPWCEIEAKAGITLFNTLVIVISANGSFNINMIWGQITSVQPPVKISSLPSPRTINITPSKKVAEYAKGRNLRKYLAIAFAIVAVIALVNLPIKGIFFFFSLIITFFLAKKINGSDDIIIRKELTSTHTEAQRNCDLLKERWIKEADNNNFASKLQELTRAREKYLNLENVKRSKLTQLNNDRQKRQLEKYLDQCRINDASIMAIGPGRKATLQSYGIETALDITKYAIGAVPGFGPVLTSNLTQWRQSIEKKFIFNPQQGIDQADIAKLNKEILEVKQALEQTLIKGADELIQIARNIANSRAVLKPYLEKSTEALAQATLDLKTINS